MNPHAWARLAVDYSDDEKYDNRLSELRNRLRGNPLDAVSWCELGKLQFIRRSEESESTIREALRLNPDYVEAWMCLAWIFDSQHRAADAEQAFEKAVLLDSDCLDAWKRLRTYYAASGRNEKAADAYRKIKTIDPLYE